jgi:hypothetical protein
VLKYGNEGTKVLRSQSYSHSLSFLLMRDICSASGSKETAESNHRQFWYRGRDGVPLFLTPSHILLLHLKLQQLWPRLSDSNMALEVLLKPMYLSLTAFQFHTFTHKFLRPTLSKLSIPFLCANPSPALGHHVTPIPTLSQCLQHTLWADSGAQNMMTQLEYEHLSNISFRIWCNKFSQWYWPTFKSCNICVLKTVFFL